MATPQQRQYQPSTHSDYAYLEQIRNYLRTICNIVVFWTVVAGIGLVLMLLVMMLGAASA